MAKSSGEDAVLDNLIIGSSFAAYATARALFKQDAYFEVLDVAYDLEPDIAAQAARLARTPKTEWNSAAEARLFPPAEASRHGVDRRQLFGSDFVYRIPKPFSVKTENCETQFSHALGGFGNVWGGAMMPYHASELDGWPIDQEELAQSYRNVLEYTPLSAERDDLADGFPLHTATPQALRRSGQTEAILNGLAKCQPALQRQGAVFGRARVAVDSSESFTGCHYCGRCLEGCVYGAIFQPRLAWSSIPGMEGGSANPRFHNGYYALEFSEHSDFVEVVAIDIRTGDKRTWRAKRIFLCLGHMGTTRMIARSLNRIGERIRTLDTQYYFFPMLSYGARKQEPIEYTLAEAFIELNNPSISAHKQHMQVYGQNPIFENMVEAMTRGLVPKSPILRRFYLFQGYLHSEDSGGVDLEITSSTDTHDEIIVHGRTNPNAHRVAKKVQSLIRGAMRPFGFVPPGGLSLVPPGRSFHAGGSFPMGGEHPVYSSDTLGRPSGLKRVHIAGPSSFPTIPSSTISFSILANADRIARATLAVS